MVLYLIGLGLGDEYDVTLKGLRAIRSSSVVYLEHYTAILTDVSTSRLAALYEIDESKLKVADRETVELHCDTFLKQALTSDVSLLIVGDVFAATTHTDLLLRAHELGVKVEVIFNASIINACGIVGLQLYNFGQIISIPFFSPSMQQTIDRALSNQSTEKKADDEETEPINFSWLDKIEVNRRMNMHTLCLLDIKVREQLPENIAANRPIFEAPRFMTVNQAAKQIIELVAARDSQEQSTSQSSGNHARITKNSLAFGLARIGRSDQCIVSGELHELLDKSFGLPLHSVVVAAPELHFMEREMFEFWHWDRANRSVQRAEEKKRQEEAGQAKFEAEATVKRAEQQARMAALAARKAEAQVALQEQMRTASLQSQEQQEDEPEIADFEPLI